MRLVSNSLQNLAVVCGFALAFAPVLSGAPAKASSEVVLYSFQGGSDGEEPWGTLISDDAGNLYGTTTAGGVGTGCAPASGCGTIFKVAPDGSETVLYAFAGGCDGATPTAGLIRDANGNLYGTTTKGGKCKNSGFGTVFKLAPDGTESALYAFRGNADGFGPYNGLIADKHGNLYGTTNYGGYYGGMHCDVDGCGTVFRISLDGAKTTLYAFRGDNDGWIPNGSLIVDKSGNLYGETELGGDGCTQYSGGCGTIFEIAPNGTKTTLYAFKAGSDGYEPMGGLTSDRAGNLYGVTAYGGSDLTNCTGGCGVVFELAPDGTETVPYTFEGGSDGYLPRSAPVIDESGNLFGTTSIGGSDRCKRLSIGCGTIFKLAPNGTETILDDFLPWLRLGKAPHGGLLLKKNGMLYGTAELGGAYKHGTVFKLINK